MKRNIRNRILLLILCFSLNAFSQTEFDITYNAKYAEKPTYTEIPEDNAISQEKANELFTFLKDSTGLEYRYSYGGCEDRAHAMALILKSKKITTCKIWNFDPYYISLFNAQQRLSSIDASGLNEKVFWGYHVAPIVKIKSGVSSEIKVIDPSIANSVLTVNEWIKLQNSPNSYYTFTDFEWFSFVTINGWQFNEQPVPTGFPTLLTGDFYKNEGENLEKHLVEEGIAINKIAMIIKKEIIDDPRISQKKKQVYKNLLLNITDFTETMNKASETPFTEKEDESEFVNYQKQYANIKKIWKHKLDLLRVDN